MAQITIDMSGVGGLSLGFHGNADELTPRPERITKVLEGQMVSGFYNPYIRDGYMFPVTTTSITCTTSTAPGSELVAVEYDPVSGKQFWANNERIIYSGSDISATSMTEGLVLEAADVVTFPERGYNSLYDLQMYYINGEDRLFYVGKGLPYSTTPVEIDVATKTADSLDWYTLFVAITPSTGSAPQIIASSRTYVSSTGDSNAAIIGVETGADKTLWALAISENQDVLTATWQDTSGTPSYAMAQVASGSSSPFRYKLFRLDNPAVIPGGVVRTTVSGSNNRVVYLFQTNNSGSAAKSGVDSSSGTAATLTADVEPLAGSQLSLVAGYTFTATEPSPIQKYLANDLFNETNTFGSDFLYILDLPISGLQVGIARPDFTLGNSSWVNWLNKSPVGAFLDYLPGDYAFMRLADNGFAYVFAGNKVHKIDGTILGGENGTVTKNVLLFPENFEITDAVDYRSNMFMAIHQYNINNSSPENRIFTGRCGVYVWDRFSVQFSNSDFIELPGVKEIRKIYISPDQVLKLIVVADSGLVELREFGYNDSGGVVYRSVATLGVGAYPKHLDSFTSMSDKSAWLGSDGTVYLEKANVITKLYSAKTAGGTEAAVRDNISGGAVLYGSLPGTADTGFRATKQALTMSYYDSSTHTFVRIFPFDLKTSANAAQSPNPGNVYSGVFYIPHGSIVRNVRVYNAPVAGSGTDVVATVKLYFNQSTAATMPSGMTKTITKDEAKRGYVDFHINKPYVQAVQLEVEWDTVIPLGDDTYMPSVAIITTDETEQKSPDNG